MLQELGEVRGRIAIRPWRVGQVVDVEAPDEVHRAIANLSSIWGGSSMPILDSRLPRKDLERLGEQHHLDSIYSDDPTGEVADLVQSPGWRWRGRGPWGPFETDAGIRKGLLPAEAFLDPTTELVQASWSNDDPSALALSAIWGTADRFHPWPAPDAHDGTQQLIAHLDLLVARRVSGQLRGPLEAGDLHLNHLRRHDGRPDGTWIYVIRAGEPRDAVDYWNLRAGGEAVVGLPANDAYTYAQQPVRRLFKQLTDKSVGSSPVVRTCGLLDAGDEAETFIRGAAQDAGVELHDLGRSSARPHSIGSPPTTFERTIRSDFRPSAPTVDLPVPTVPLRMVSRYHSAGVVAVVVEFDRVAGLDPRFTAVVPPYRRHSALLARRSARDDIDHVRTSTSGYVFGVDATAEHLAVPFVFNVDAIAALFGDDVKIGQSEVGRFQTRAAEKLGGPFGGVANEPGMRSVLESAASRATGMPLPQLRRIVEDDRGEWPDELFARDISPADYARRQVDRLLSSGIFVPSLRVHCSHCRVESRVSADSLAASMTCEFCGEDFNLALSHSLTTPEWRYRLAAHLRPDQIQALLPALATSSLLGHLSHLTEVTPPLMFGVEVTLARTTVEVDVAAFLPDPDWALVLGEVKTANRVDSKDLAGLANLRDRLRSQGVRCLLAFTTLKDVWSPEEVVLLRGLVERSQVVTTGRGGALPNMPLVLTGPDVSHPWGSDDHPWRWDRKDYQGIFGTAITSCERNLGLQTFELGSTDPAREIECTWAPAER